MGIGDLSFVSTNRLVGEDMGELEISEFKVDELASIRTEEPQHGPSFGTLETLPMETEPDLDRTGIRIKMQCPVARRVLNA